jgi:alpha-beta hydrolase superfamily lysophospholipase
VLVIGNTADDACTPSHTQAIYDGVGHNNKQLKHVEGATHYYFMQPDKAEQAADIVMTWLEEQGLR